MNQRRHLSAFTLIELLAVVVIIGVLMAIVFPAIIRAITDSEKVSVRQEVSAIERSIADFMTKYGSYPIDYKTFPATSSDIMLGGNDTTLANTHIINNLTGTNVAANVIGINGNPGMNNPEKKRFMEFTEERYDRRTNYKDIWGQPYYIVIDHNNDNNLDFTLPNGGGPVQIKGRKAAVWSEGDPNDNPRNRIMSWD
jgi:prepilin-type N-terminal cleavage/methylation domain-containing protein